MLSSHSRDLIVCITRRYAHDDGIAFVDLERFDLGFVSQCVLVETLLRSVWTDEQCT